MHLKNYLQGWGITEWNADCTNEPNYLQIDEATSLKWVTWIQCARLKEEWIA